MNKSAFLRNLKREYFFEINSHGQLFHQDTKVKNFTSMHKHVPFLNFFFRNIKRNSLGRYPEYNYISQCGNEINYIKTDFPIVFHSLIDGNLIYGGNLKIKFDIEKVVCSKGSGLFLHEYGQNDCKYGVLKDSLVIKEFFDDLGEADISYNGKLYKLNWID
jgi:hypothetical protein